MGRTACTEPQCLYKGALYLTLLLRPLYTFNGVNRASSVVGTTFSASQASASLLFGRFALLQEVLMLITLYPWLHFKSCLHFQLHLLKHVNVLY
jgi:hypothetical protein